MRQKQLNVVNETKKRILMVIPHNAFREALTMRLDREEDLEVAWQAGSIAGTGEVHLDGIDVALVDPLLPDGDGLELVREVSVANPKALSVVLYWPRDQALYNQALRAGADEVLATSTSIDEIIDPLRNRQNQDPSEDGRSKGHRVLL